MDGQKTISTKAEVMERFTRKAPETVEYGGAFFSIRKMPALAAVFSKDIMSLPFVAEAIPKFKAMSEEERLKVTSEWVGHPEYLAALRKAAVILGVVEPKFSDELPCPEGSIPYDETDEDLLEFLANQVMLLSNFDKKASEFFRAGAGGEAAGARHGLPEVQAPAQ